MTRKLLQNKAQCRVCLVTIESKHVHDYVPCRCGAIAVDGGHEYAQRTGDATNIIDLCVWEEVLVPDVQETVSLLEAIERFIRAYVARYPFL